MKVVLFCGGRGMRMREFSDIIPKPMVPVGPRPVMWHLMRYYAHYGHTEFILALGDRGEYIKRYFLEYEEWRSNDFTLENGDVSLMGSDIDEWQITFVDTGLNSNIGERLSAVRDHIGGDSMFIANYADGLSDVPLDSMISHLDGSDAVGIMLAMPPSQSFHVVEVDNAHAVGLSPAESAGILVNGGYFIFKDEIWDYLKPGEELVIEPFRRLADQRRLLVHRHDGFWLGMDTFKDRQVLDEMYQAGDAPWTPPMLGR